MILDTNAVSALLAGRDEQLNSVLESSEPHQLPLTVIGEYQFGLLALNRPRRLQSLLRKLEVDSIILYPDRATADIYAAIRHELKLLGRPTPRKRSLDRRPGPPAFVRDRQPLPALRPRARRPQGELVGLRGDNVWHALVGTPTGHDVLRKSMTTKTRACHPGGSLWIPECSGF